MNIEVRTFRNVIVLSIVPDMITMYGTEASRVAAAVRGALAQGHDQIVLDLGHVQYLDSAGLGELVQVVSTAHNRGGTIRLLNVTGRVRALLEVTKLSAVFDGFDEEDCFDQEADALASFESKPAAR